MYRKFAIILLCSVLSVPAHAVCTLPNGVEGELVYNRDQKLVQYCDGQRWIGVGWKRSPMRAAGNAGQIQFNDGSGVLAASNRLHWNNTTASLAIGVPAADMQHNLQLRGLGGEEGVTSIFLQDPTTTAAYGGQLYYDDREGQNALILSTIAEGEDYAYFYLRRATARNIGVGTRDPAATLDINGYTRLAMNASAPASCAAFTRGSIALTSAAQMCICTPSGWQIANTSTVCAW